MHEKRIRRLPVVDDQGQLVGMLTRGDIVREMAQSYD
jgi:CBS domain-containing protein